MKVHKPLTKAQEKRWAQLETKGYDYGYASEFGNPVLVLREKRIWVEIFRNGSYGPPTPPSKTTFA